LEFIGRTDQQVKVRGFRIELAEIERVLAQHAAVEEAAVVMKQTQTESQTGDKRLVGYVVLSAGLEIGDVNRELREHVRSALPEYMVPGAVVVLERMPVTANGKLDRAVLPELEEGQEDKVLIGPRTAEEELLLDMWQQLLGVERISIDDDFFELGGHSLLATQVVARIRQVFQVELELQVLFAEPTIAGLSDAIRAQLRQGRVAVKPANQRRLGPMRPGSTDEGSLSLKTRSSVGTGRSCLSVFT
jgi:acyl carrier protein